MQPAILHRVDPDRAVELGPVAGALARVIADPAVDGRHRVVGGQPPPGPLMLASTGQPGLDVLPGQAASVTRREQVPVDGPARPHRAGPCSIMERVRQRREITWRMAHRRTSAIGLRASVRLRARDWLGKKVPYRHARQARPARWYACRWTFPVAHLGAGRTGISPFQGKTALRVAMIARSTGSPGPQPDPNGSNTITGSPPSGAATTPAASSPSVTCNTPCS